MSGPTTREQKNNNNTGARVREDGSEQAAEAPAAPEKTVDDLIEQFCFGYGDAPRLREALEKFKGARSAKKKPLTPWAMELLCKKLRRLAVDAEARDPVDYMVQALEESVVNGWSGVFALKEYRPTPPAPKRQQDSADRPRVIGADDDIAALF